ncbi:hypothetical protein [Actinomycetospora soli]|uniref:hypothetical protein n=1 Tax=Actinomycetospora soli TaxID=2893887 RepID=UPI001E2D7803|nr:hypothetical protein [Actinomycetospora soli]MCD2190564.1 hypothetical protein [Actinomycetospora soli]
MTEPGSDEQRYAEAAALVGTTPPAPADRVRSLRFTRGAEEWTATVGRPLTGRLAARTDRRPPRRAPATRSAPTRDVSDPATVRAVLPADGGWAVVTDAAPHGPVDDSTWENPVHVPDRDVREITRAS